MPDCLIDAHLKRLSTLASYTMYYTAWHRAFKVTTKHKHYSFRFFVKAMCVHTHHAMRAAMEIQLVVSCATEVHPVVSLYNQSLRVTHNTTSRNHHTPSRSK